MAKKKKTKHAKHAKTPKQFSCFIRWGSRSSQEDVYESPRDANRYDFDTEAELAAFLLGVNEANGWLDCDVFYSEEELEGEPESWDKA